MSIRIENESGWTEAILYESCEFEKFYFVAQLLEKKFEIQFISKLDNIDTYYWDFNYNGSLLSLHYNIYAGVRIFPIKFQHSSLLDNDRVVEIGKLIYEQIK